MSELALRDLVKHYVIGSEVVRAVDGVTLRVAPGEVVALYGPSGSGKTTLLLLAAGLLEPDRGEVAFDGRPLSAMTPREAVLYRRRQLGFVLQSFQLMPAASAADNAAVKLLADGWSLAEARPAATRWLARVGVGSCASRPAGSLSMGERQRVALARALANEPQLLLADEPTGNLDSSRSREVLAMLRELARERSVPVLLATHDEQAADFADRVLQLSDGQLSEGRGAVAPEPRIAR
jgi:putative ABC transport system ATP-binding protein